MTPPPHKFDAPPIHTIALKEIWYGRDPEVIYLQLTNFQSLVGIRIHSRGGGAAPSKSTVASV